VALRKLNLMRDTGILTQEHYDAKLKKLQDLIDLKNAGILTEEEYEAKRDALLAQR